MNKIMSLFKMDFSANTQSKRLGLILILISAIVVSFMAAYWMVEIKRYSSDLNDFLNFFYKQTLGTGTSFLLLAGLALYSELPLYVYEWIKIGTINMKPQDIIQNVVVLVIFCVVAYISFDYLAGGAMRTAFNP